MRKSTLFISAALTAFMLAVLFGVVSAYQNMAGSTELAAQQAPSAEVTQVAAVNPAQDQEQAQVPTQSPVQDIAPVVPAQPVTITPEQATAIASSVLGRTDLYSVEITQLSNEN